MKKGGIFIFVFAVLLIGIISATFTFTDYSLTDEYGPEETLIGWVKMSFEEESSASLFEFSVDGGSETISLLDLLNTDSSFVYTCNPLSCLSSYAVGGGGISKNWELDKEESAFVGFNIEGDNIIGISDFSILVSSDAGISETSQLTIDVLNDGGDIWKANIASGSFADKLWGCYSSSVQTATIIQTPYCEKITLPAAPNVKIGAGFIGSESATFVITIEKAEGGLEGSCEVALTGGGQIGCVPSDFVINEGGDYHVCVQAKSAEDANRYKINSETNNPCGYVGIFSGYVRDFEIFAEPGTYGAVGEFILDGEEIEGVNEDILDYIESTYDNDCSEGCIVPLKISATTYQNVDFSNAFLRYSDGGASLNTNVLYNLTENPATINADAQKLSINGAGFEVPEDYDIYTAVLEFDGNTIFSEDIKVVKVPIILSVTPTSVATFYPTTFTANIDSETEIQIYEWDFGNGDTDVTTANNVTYTYNDTGTYLLELEITDINNKTASKSFTISVGSASGTVTAMLEEKQTNLANIKTQMGSFTLFEQNVLETLLDIDTVETNLNIISDEIENTETEEDYQAILGDLMKVNIPSSLFLSLDSNSIIFYPKQENIEASALASITGESYDTSKKSKYARSILGWDVSNVDISLKQREISAISEEYEGAFLNVFEVVITKKAGCEEDPYILIKNIDNIMFATDYSEKLESGYYYFPLISESEKFTFATTELVDFTNLPLFVSPEISKLSLVNVDISPVNESGELKKWVLFALIMLLLVIVGVGFWIGLNLWYKKKYENYLFKNKNNLYNLFMWVENSKRKGLKENEIRTQLRKAGWNSEQTRYALRKYSGKRTGMPEIPVAKILKKRAEKKGPALGRSPKFFKKKKDKQNLNPGAQKRRFYNL